MKKPCISRYYGSIYSLGLSFFNSNAPIDVVYAPTGTVQAKKLPVMMVPMAPAVVMPPVPVPPAVVVAPVAAVMAPMAVMMVTVAPMARVVAVAEVVVVPLHGLDRGVRGERRGRCGGERGGFGGAGTDQTARHQREGGKCEAGAPPRRCVRHGVTSIRPAVRSASENARRRP